MSLSCCVGHPPVRLPGDKHRARPENTVSLPQARRGVRRSLAAKAEKLEPDLHAPGDPQLHR